MVPMTSSRSQIVATIGPKSGTKDVLREMVRHHMDVMRLNLSWGTHEEHAAYIEALRAVATEMGAHIPVIFDLAGPRKQTTTGHQFDASQYKPEKGLLTAKDTEDIRFGLSKSVEYVCVSYVGRKEDVEEAKGKIAEFGGTAKVIAKIPFIEREIIGKCTRAGKPVITATQMLLSMVENPEPTRAEVTDVAYAIEIGSDAVMLSEETARGAYPVEAVAEMEKIVLEAERHTPGRLVNLL